MPKYKAKKNANKRPLLISSVLLIVIILVVSVWLGFHDRNPKQVATIPTTTTTTPTSADTGKQANPTGATGTAISGTDTKTSASTPAQPADFIAPVGTFINNHHPNLSGAPAPNNMESDCHTTPGADCQITFMKADVVKKLESKTADANGNVTWYWKLQDAGLTEGKWQIIAIASSAGKTKTTSDPMAFEVGL